jgi:hypothetical protein
MLASVDERLASIAPDLAGTVVSSPKRGRWLAARACGLAVRTSGLLDERAARGVQAVEREESNASSEETRALADELDAAAWTAEDAGDGEGYDRMFRQARAASSLAFALDGEHAESIYEAVHSFASPEDLLRLLREGS